MGTCRAPDNAIRQPPKPSHDARVWFFSGPRHRHFTTQLYNLQRVPCGEPPGKIEAPLSHTSARAPELKDFHSHSLDSEILSEESSSPEPPEANANPKLHQPRNANPKLHQQEERQFEASSALQPPSELSRGLSGLTGAAGRRPRVIHEPAGGPGLSSASTSSPPAAESTSDDHGPRKLRLLRAELLNKAAEGRHSKKLPRGSAQRAPPSSKRRAAGVPSPSPHVPKHHRSAM